MVEHIGYTKCCPYLRKISPRLVKHLCVLLLCCKFYVESDGRKDPKVDQDLAKLRAGRHFSLLPNHRGIGRLITMYRVGQKVRARP